MRTFENIYPHNNNTKHEHIKLNACKNAIFIGFSTKKIRSELAGRPADQIGNFTVSLYRAVVNLFDVAATVFGSSDIKPIRAGGTLLERAFRPAKCLKEAMDETRAYVR